MTQRKSNIELLRIILMLIIISHHYVVNSGLTNLIYGHEYTFKDIYYLLFGFGGKIAINIFILITGYFMCTSKITLNKFVKLLFEVEFYKLLTLVFFIVTGYATFTLKSAIYYLLPITSIWIRFTECYLIFYLLIPFVNKFIKSLSQKEHLIFILIVLFFFSILGSLSFISVTINYVTWFIFIYFIGAYIRLYPETKYLKIINDKKKSLFFLLFFLILAFISIPYKGYFYVNDVNKILAVLIAVFTFLFFINININYNKFINTAAASTFGILQIHANSDLMRSWLWGNVFNTTYFYHTNMFILHSILTVIIVYVVCLFIDIVRINCIEKYFLKYFDYCLKKFKTTTVLKNMVK